MKFLKKFNESNNINIDEICNQYNIKNYVINNDGTIDVQGNVFLDRQNLTELPLNFNRVFGNFYCGGNQLTSLKGSPIWVGLDFRCEQNQLENLEFFPKTVEGAIWIQRNKLSTLNGIPSKILDNLYFDENPIYTTEGFPESVEGKLGLYDCPIDDIGIVLYTSISQLKDDDYDHYNDDERTPYGNFIITELVKLQDLYNFIRGNKIIEVRLKSLLEEEYNISEIPKPFYDKKNMKYKII